MYKQKVEIPPLMMQDDTLAVSTCEVKTLKMNNFINTQTNLMGLQFGKKKCVELHVGKKYNADICIDCKDDIWGETVSIEKDGKYHINKEFVGSERMEKVNEKKYLGDIISFDVKNKKNIVEKTNRAVGITNKISTTLSERPYGRHHYKAAKLMRESMMFGSMLNNSESWINLTKSDIETLEKLDTITQRSIFENNGNPSRVFMSLELGIVPVKFVIMEKRLKFLKYILEESTSSMIRQVYETLRKDSTKGDFIDLVKKDMEELCLTFTEEDIKDMNKIQWKKYVKEVVKEKAFEFLKEENGKKSKTKHITFEQFSTREYLVNNENKSLSKLIFSARSGTLDLKVWNEWKYGDKTCVMCQKDEENFDHFMTCFFVWTIRYRIIIQRYIWKQP